MILSFKIFFFALSQAFSGELFIVDKVLYGEDNRRLVSEMSNETKGDRFLLEASSVVFAQVPNWRITKYNKDDFSIQTKTLADGINLCPDERFHDLPSVSSCSAFLVDEDLLLTAGHCLKDKYDCLRQTWILDYEEPSYDLSSSGLITFKNTQSYTCKKLEGHSVGANLDFALVRLDRKVNRSPLKLRVNGKVGLQESLAIIGHPLGLPKIISTNGRVRENSLPNFFKSNLDAFSGNSGSPVIGESSGLVEGILIRGEDDFKYDDQSYCQRPLLCLDKECRGESVLRSSAIPFKKIHK